jgi:mono/diheme cytochrome c family protein
MVFALTLSATTGWTQAVSAQATRVPLAIELPDDASVGASLFREQGCSRCHSLGGGGAGLAPDLANLRLDGSVLDLAGTFWNHAPVMRERMQDRGLTRPDLTPSEMSTLIAWLGAYRHYNRAVREPPDPALGRRVFVTKGCAGCHERRGAAAPAGPDLTSYRGRSPVFFAEAMWNHLPEMASALEANGGAWPTFQDREMADLAAYLQVGLALAGPDSSRFEPGSPREGEALFAAKGCINCHTVAGRGGQDGLELAEPLVRVRSVAEIAGVMWNHSVDMRPEYERRNLSHPRFLGGEMADLLAYLYFVSYASVEGRPDRGGEVFVRRCSTCHALGRTSVGPDLLVAPDLDDAIGIVTAMWNHAATMEGHVGARRASWPALQRGETADLAAFVITRRAAAGTGR